MLSALYGLSLILKTSIRAPSFYSTFFFFFLAEKRTQGPQLTYLVQETQLVNLQIQLIHHQTQASLHVYYPEITYFKILVWAMTQVKVSFIK